VIGVAIRGGRVTLITYKVNVQELTSRYKASNINQNVRQSLNKKKKKKKLRLVIMHVLSTFSIIVVEGHSPAMPSALDYH